MAQIAEKLIVDFEARINDFEKKIAKAQGSLATHTRRMKADADKMEKGLRTHFTGAAKSMGLLIGPMAALAGSRAFLSYAEGWTRVQNSLRVAGLEGQQLESTLDRLFAIAQRGGASIEAMASLFGRLSGAQKDIGASTDQLIQFTEGVSLALKIAGTDAGAASGALMQLGQALGSSRIQAEEFNSIVDQGKPILQAAANNIEEAAGNVSKLKQLVNDGKLSNKAFFDAFLMDSAKLQEQAAKSADTQSQANTRIGNAFTKLAGIIGKETGATQGAIDAFNGLAAVFEIAATKAEGLGPKLSGLTPYLKAATNALSPFLAAQIAAYEGLKRLSSNTPDPNANVTIVPKGTPPKPQKPISVDDPNYKPLGSGDGAKRDAAAEVIRDLEFEAEQLKLTAREQQIANDIRRAGAAVTAEQSARIRELSAAGFDAEESQRKLNESMQLVKETASDAIKGFVSDIREGVDASEALANSLSRVADRLLDFAIDAALQAALKSLSGATGGGSGGWVTSVIPNAKGNVLSGGRVTPFARGGVVNRPTMFPMARGVGVMAEAGPEAIMPLRRGPDGKLGVQAAGGGAHVTVNIINKSADASVRTERRQEGGGERLDVIIDRMTAANLSRPGSDTARAQRRQFGAAPALTRRS